jgi:hypothetical protein
MNPPRHTLAVTVPVADLLDAKRAGMLPAALTDALWRAVERVGGLELHALEAEQREWNEHERAQPDARGWGKKGEE